MPYVPPAPREKRPEGYGAWNQQKSETQRTGFRCRVDPPYAQRNKSRRKQQPHAGINRDAPKNDLHDLHRLPSSYRRRPQKAGMWLARFPKFRILDAVSSMRFQSGTAPPRRRPTLVASVPPPPACLPLRPRLRLGFAVIAEARRRPRGSHGGRGKVRNRFPYRAIKGMK